MSSIFTSIGKVLTIKFLFWERLNFVGKWKAQTVVQHVCKWSVHFMENSPFSISFVLFSDGCFLLIIALVKIFKPWIERGLCYLTWNNVVNDIFPCIKIIVKLVATASATIIDIFIAKIFLFCQVIDKIFAKRLIA